jgi:hypothetical protein
MGIHLYNKYGFPNLADKEFTKHLKLFNTPKSLISKNVPKRIYMNADMKEPLYAVLNELHEGDIKTWDGVFNIRPIRGYENLYLKLIEVGNLSEASKYLSSHSWGMAIDINASTNKLNTKGDMNHRIVETFLKHGFMWGGNFKRLDPMHFEL